MMPISAAAISNLEDSPDGRRDGTSRQHQALPRMGRIAYLNVLPIYHALETGRVPHGYELVYGPPSVLNTMMQKGELVVASTSSIEYARRPEKYWILPDLAIGSHGKVQSVLLVSRRPVAELDGKTVLVSTATHTSVALLTLLLKEHARVSVTLVAGDTAAWLATDAASHKAGLCQGALAPREDRPKGLVPVSEERAVRASRAEMEQARLCRAQRFVTDAPEAMLVIGDEALRSRNHPVYSHIWDLGEEWFAWTGLPFTFGLWVVSRGAAKRQGLAEDPAAVLHAGRDWSRANRDATLRAAMERYPYSREALIEYFTCLSYTLGDREQQGLRLFYNQLAAAGEIPAAPDLAFWPGKKI